MTWFALAFAVHPHWSAVARDTVVPSLPPGGITGSLVFLVIAIVGTTIAPWQLFFQPHPLRPPLARHAARLPHRHDPYARLPRPRPRRPPPSIPLGGIEIQVSGKAGSPAKHLIDLGNRLTNIKVSS